MLSKNKIKFLKSLHQQKYRKIHQLYLVEGHKSVLEWLKDGRYAFECIASADWREKYESDFLSDLTTFHTATAADLKQLSQLNTPPEVILVAQMPQEVPDLTDWKVENLCLVLDRIQDPGNVGTILRTADWFGIHQMIVLKGTVELYNPKLVQASMGSLLRMNYLEMDETEFLAFAVEKSLNLIVADMEGVALNSFKKPENALLIMGNEGRGVSVGIKAAAGYAVKIEGSGEAESLNVGIAAAIMMYELGR